MDLICTLFHHSTRHSHLPVNKIEERIVLYVWAILVSFSRLVLLEHWFTDVLVGVVIGLAAGYLVKSKLAKRIFS